MAMQVLLMAPLLAFSLGSPTAQGPPRTTEVPYPVGTWDGGSSALLIRRDQLEWEVRSASLIVYVKAQCEVSHEGMLRAVVTEATCCLGPGPIEQIKKGDSFSFRFRIKDGSLILTELQGRFLGDNKQKQRLEAVYKKQ